MKKILIAFEGAHFSEGAFEFARRLHEKSPVLLTGVFLPQVDYANLWSYADGTGGPLFIPLVEKDDTAVINKNIEKFETSCRRNGIDCRVHKDFYDFALPELKKETRFADLVIIGSETFYENLGTHEPNDYLRDALHASECPVIVVPEKFSFPEQNILAYDGSESSVYAMKQFAYILPEFSSNKTLLIYVKSETEELPDESYIEEWTARHFNDLTLTKLDMDPRKYFTTWIDERKSAILVSGAFGRSAISQLFKKSFVSDVIRDHRLPVFITHR